MSFYALRIECRSCGNVFIVGGDRRNDLARWAECEVECPHCQAREETAEGRMVDLAAVGATTGVPRALRTT